MSVLVPDWMLLAGDDDTLADELAALLDERGPRSCVALALALERRKADVLDALRADSRFEHEGHGRGSRWRTRDRRPQPSSWEQQGTVPRGSRSISIPPDGGDAHSAITRVRYASRRAS